MRIAIINKTAGGMSGGYRKYLCNIIPRLASNLNVESILCASPKSLKIHELLGELPNVKFINCQPFRFLHHKVEPELENYLEKFSPDIIFIPLARYFEFNNIPIVNMLRNMEPFTDNLNNNFIFDKCKLYAQRLISKKAVEKSDRVIAISKYVKEFLMYNWNIPENKIGLVYHGIELPKDEEIQLPQNITKDWEGKFIFTAGSIRPARGLEDVFIAMKYLLLKKKEIKGLVVAGDISPNMIGYKNKLKKWIQTQDLSSKIYLAGNLNKKEMNWCYRNCKIFVMTSRIEACPSIVLEAMSHGCISISADNPPLPEIFGDAAIFYSPKRQEVLVATIQAVLRWDNYKRKKMSEIAKRQAAKFSWDVTVEKILIELSKAIESYRLKQA